MNHLPKLSPACEISLISPNGGWILEAYMGFIDNEFSLCHSMKVFQTRVSCFSSY